MTLSRGYFLLPFLLLCYSAAATGADEAVSSIKNDLSFSSQSELENGERMLIEFNTEYEPFSCSLRILEETNVDGDLKSSVETVIPIADIDVSRLDDVPEFLASGNPAGTGGIFFHSLGQGFDQEKFGFGIPANLHSVMVRSATYEECNVETCRSSESVLFAYLWPENDLQSARTAIAELRSDCSIE